MSEAFRDLLIKNKSTSPDGTYVHESMERVDAAHDAALADWIAYADKLEQFLELVCGQSKDWLMKKQAEQGLRLVRPSRS